MCNESLFMGSEHDERLKRRNWEHFDYYVFSGVNS